MASKSFALGRITNKVLSTPPNHGGQRGASYPWVPPTAAVARLSERRHSRGHHGSVLRDAGAYVSPGTRGRRPALLRTPSLRFAGPRFNIRPVAFAAVYSHRAETLGARPTSKGLFDRNPRRLHPRTHFTSYIDHRRHLNSTAAECVSFVKLRFRQRR